MNTFIQNGNGKCPVCLDGVLIRDLYFNAFDSHGKIHTISVQSLMDVFLEQARQQAEGLIREPETLTNNNFVLSSQYADREITLENTQTGLPSTINLGPNIQSGQSFNLTVRGGDQPIIFVNRFTIPICYNGEFYQPGEVVTPLSRNFGGNLRYELTFTNRGTCMELRATITDLNATGAIVDGPIGPLNG